MARIASLIAAGSAGVALLFATAALAAPVTESFAAARTHAAQAGTDRRAFDTVDTAAPGTFRGQSPNVPVWIDRHGSVTAGRSGRRSDRERGRPAPLESIHPLALRTCRVSRLLRPICPRRVHMGFYPRSGIFLAPWRGDGIVRYDHFDLNGFRERGDRRRPRTRHLVLYASRRSLSSRGGPFADWPVGTRPIGLRNGLTQRPRLAPPRLLARVRWAGRRGELVLERPYPNGGVDGNHVVFRWRQGGIEYAASLHEWEPLREAVATLHAIVRSMPRA